MQILGNIVQQLQQQNNVTIAALRELRGNMSIQVLLNPMNRHGVDVVFDIINNPQFEEERKKAKNPNNITIIWALRLIHYTGLHEVVRLILLGLDC